MSMVYVWAYPVFQIIAWVEEWHLSQLDYDKNFLEAGIESFQDGYLPDFMSIVMYHYL
jgi:hypothetical protein